MNKKDEKTLKELRSVLQKMLVINTNISRSKRVTREYGGDVVAHLKIMIERIEENKL